MRKALDCFARAREYAARTGRGSGPRVTEGYYAPPTSGDAMPPWAEDCLRLGKQQGYLTFAELRARKPDGVGAAAIRELFVLLEKEGVPLGSGDPRALTRYSPEVAQGWKSYPAHLEGPSLSKCCKQPTVLVQSMKGGFVSVNCSKCGKPDTLSQGCFMRLPFWVSCPSCKGRMGPCVTWKVRRSGAAGVPCKVDANYKYACLRCRLYILLADLLPDWADLNFALAR